MNRKPIFVVKLPISIGDDGYEVVSSDLNKRLGLEYHVLVCQHSGEDVEFQQFDETNISPTDLENLKAELKLKADRRRTSDGSDQPGPGVSTGSAKKSQKQNSADLDGRVFP